MLQLGVLAKERTLNRFNGFIQHAATSEMPVNLVIEIR
jgi:hypothetical protein